MRDMGNKVDPLLSFFWYHHKRRRRWAYPQCSLPIWKHTRLYTFFSPFSLPLPAAKSCHISVIVNVHMSSFTASSFLFKIFPISWSSNAGKNRTKHLSTYDTFQPQPAECMIFKSELFSSDDDNSHPSRLHPIQYSITLGGTTSGDVVLCMQSDIVIMFVMEGRSVG